jgi:RimJ/RimL family protein N-acetyltransferase
MLFPPRIATPRALLRAWHSDDAPRLRQTIDANLDYLLPWIPWARDEPTTVEQLRARLEGDAAGFVNGSSWIYGIFSLDGSSILGGIGLYPRIGPGGVEIGYWIDRTHAGKGLATELARILIDLALTRDDITHVELHCDPHNLPSAAIARRLGFALIETRRDVGTTPSGASRDLMIWRLSRSESPSSGRRTGP